MKTKKDMESIDVTVDDDKDRYSRLKLIHWWDQKKLKEAKVMVVGAGALGNEILKNLAMLGVGNIIIVDMDSIENSNLTRSVLFREKDEGRNKAEAAAEMLKNINPGINVKAINGNINFDIGLGVFKEMDAVIGGLDNREARLNISHSCWKVTTPYIDGAIEVLDGVARVFIPPEGACYECTMSELDFKILNQRKSCALLNRDEMLLGKVPTTPTIASIIAGVQVQEFIKIVHQRENLKPMKSQGFYFNGVSNESYIVEYSRKKDCSGHETIPELHNINFGTEDIKLSDLLKIFKEKHGEETVIELENDLIYNIHCDECNTKIDTIGFLGRLTEKKLKCPVCGKIMSFETTNSISGNESFIEKTPAELGIPLYDIILVRNGFDFHYYLFNNDYAKALNF